MFRFDYSIEFLQWALSPPGSFKDWVFGVRGGKQNKLFGFISGIPVHMNVNGSKVMMAEINFLCVHKKLRTKRLAPVLILEVTRRVNMRNIWQAIYTAGIVIPIPICKTTYWHRSLNPKKLVDVKFSALPAQTPMNRYIKMLKVPAETSTKVLRVMKKADVPAVTKLLHDYLADKTKVFCELDEDDVAHFLLPREGVLSSYVVVDPETKEITDFVSFYHLPSSILKHDKYDTLCISYSYYNVARKTPIKELMKDALVLAKNKGADVFNALDIMENDEFLKDLKFGIGDGNLHYYFYNWRVKEFAPADIGMVLV